MEEITGGGQGRQDRGCRIARHDNAVQGRGRSAKHKARSGPCYQDAQLHARTEAVEGGQDAFISAAGRNFCIAARTQNQFGWDQNNIPIISSAPKGRDNLRRLCVWAELCNTGELKRNLEECPEVCVSLVSLAVLTKGTSMSVSIFDCCGRLNLRSWCLL